MAKLLERRCGRSRCSLTLAYAKRGDEDALDNLMDQYQAVLAVTRGLLWLACAFTSKSGEAEHCT